MHSQVQFARLGYLHHSLPRTTSLPLPPLAKRLHSQECELQRRQRTVCQRVLLPWKRLARVRYRVVGSENMWCV
ncbi:hypothetical protein NC652_003260 [Populus alba x Populus x berolinensis]|nr:hypothetical protein NC652_003260 [Populus alba x Populus x berolinensis]